MNVPPSRTRRRARHAVGVVGLAAVVGLALFFDLARPDFWDPGESRYAETVREMIVTGNWFEPTLGFLPYYDKPPGFFWLVAAAFHTLGPSEWAARLPSALAAMLTIASVVAFAWSRLGPRAALGAGIVLATAIQFVVLGRSVRMDMLLTLLTTASLLWLYLLLEPGTTERRTWALWVLPAAGLLVKGPVAVVLPVAIALAFMIVTRTRPRLRLLRPSLVTAGGLILVAFWYLAEAARSPDYLWTFLWQHNLGRFMGRALAGHPEPFWYFLWILPITFLPWSLFLPGALRRGWRRARRGDRLTIFLLVWCAVPFVFFSVSRAKLATYLLPIFPALALLVAAYLDRVLRAPAAARLRALRIPAMAWTAAFGLIVVAGPVVTALAYPAHVRAALAIVLLAAFPVCGWLVVRWAEWRAVPALIAIAALAMQALFYRVGAPVVNEFSSLREAAEIARELPPDASIFAYKTRGHSFTYYGGRTLMRVRSPAGAAEVLAYAPPTAVLVKARHLEKIRQYLVAPACIWWQSSSGRVLLANRPRRDPPGGHVLAPATAATASAPSGDDPPPC